MPRTVPVGNFFVGANQPLTIISGPCIIEDEEHTLFVARQLKEIFSKLPVQFIFKASYDKANRTSIHSFRGPGMEKGLAILERVKRELGVPVLSDVHSPEEAPIAAEVLDVLQIPAFLCRQTDLIVACAKTGRAIHVKKGQFVAPHDMGQVVEKIRSCGNDKVLLVDRGTCFGYNMLISDMRAIPMMKKFGTPVIFDASHSVQRPGGQGTATGGDREFIPTLARAAVASGADGIFFESHPDPSQAKSDAATVFPLDQVHELVSSLAKLFEVTRSFGDA
jgi:2-dehydro-3-deoxyphosphooctonate aldolase (KDO 8-P synthase)